MEFIYVCVRLQCDLRMQKQIKPMAAVPAVMMEEQYLFMSSGLRSRAPKREECRLVDVPERRRARNVVWFTFQSARGRGMSSSLRSRTTEGEKCRLVYIPERRRARNVV